MANMAGLRLFLCSTRWTALPTAYLKHPGLRAAEKIFQTPLQALKTQTSCSSSKSKRTPSQHTPPTLPHLPQSSHPLHTRVSVVGWHLVPPNTAKRYKDVRARACRWLFLCSASIPSKVYRHTQHTPHLEIQIQRKVTTY